MPPIATVWTVTDARRGEIWLLDLGEPLGHEQGWQRPALILSSDRWNRHAATVTVLPLTRTHHGLPTRIEIEPDDDNGLDETSYARCEDVRSVSERRLTHRVGMVDDLTMSRVGPVLRRFLEIS
jgi:mRNA interferase MazF